MPVNITLQEMFNKVWERAKIKEKSRAYSPKFGKTCAYRNSDGSGNHCFIGICIPDEDYKQDFEGQSVNDSQINSLFPLIETKAMIDLQRIHDLNYPEHWDLMLRGYAKDYNLTIPE